jgi:hypothetical protein
MPKSLERPASMRSLIARAPDEENQQRAGARDERDRTDGEVATT